LSESYAASPSLVNNKLDARQILAPFPQGRRDRSGRSIVTVKKKRSADTEQLMVGGCTPLSTW
jgi:hypothetical protein